MERKDLLPESTSRLVLDTISLEAKSQHLPEPMRERFIWLGTFVREECNRDIDLLNDRFKAIGVHHDKTTWSKILRGFWNRLADGRDCPPCLAEEKFCKCVDSLRNDARIKEQGGRIPFVMTPTAQKIFDFIEVRRAPDRINKFGIIVGETGSQKTASTMEYARRNNHGLVVRVEAPETASMSQFMTDLARAYGYSVLASYPRKKAFVLEAVTARKTIIVENIQRLYEPRHADRQPIFSFLQKLQEDTGCTIILTITPVFERTLLGGFTKGFFEQFEGRAGGRRAFLRLAPFPQEDDVLAIAQAFKLQDAKRHVEFLTDIAREPGRVRRLFEDLQDAKIEAEADGKALTIGHIKAVRGEN